MNAKPIREVNQPDERPWPLDLSVYDRNPLLTDAERVALASTLHLQEARNTYWLRHHRASISRLVHPIYDVLNFIRFYPNRSERTGVVRILMQKMNDRGTSYWAWSDAEWIDLIGTNINTFDVGLAYRTCRCALMAFSYIISGFSDLHRWGRISYYRLSVTVFGKPAVDTAIETVRSEMIKLGYADTCKIKEITNVVCKALLASRSPSLAGITLGTLERLRTHDPTKATKGDVIPLSRALAKLRIIAEPLAPRTGQGCMKVPAESGVPSEWAGWCRKWVDTTTLETTTRTGHYYCLMKAGRWIAAHNLKLASPQAWGYEEAAEYVAALTRSKVGDWATRISSVKDRLGKPLKPAAIASNLAGLRIFFRDSQEWGWVERRFDPGRAFNTPKSVKAKLAPNPRVIADDVWAKLLWAGLNITEADLPKGNFRIKSGEARSYYPLEMIRALATVWLFAGLRMDEILRLRVGCTRWQREDIVVPETKDILRRDEVCWLDVPVNKTQRAFTKPVDRPVGEAIEAWERLRPEQAPVPDDKTGEMVHYLFSFRGKSLGYFYLNDRLIPMLCRKAGVPKADARGAITCHRARSTIASQLYNSKEPLTLFELQEWLGHKCPNSTLYYAKVSPTKLAKKYAEAGYFERNVRTVEILIDREAIISGAAAQGVPWQYYDLGHGWCTNAYFIECPHRMACPKCNFYVPKASTKGQLLEGRSNLLRMRQEIPLTEDEVSAIDEGVRALEKLCEKLADVPTPAGPTPRQLIQLTRSGEGNS